MQPREGLALSATVTLAMRQPNQFGKVLIVLLGALLAVFMTFEVAHSHPAGDVTASAHCQVCATAHAAVASQPAWLTSFVLHIIGKVVLGEPSRGSRAVVHTAFIRPPPVVELSIA